MIIENKCTLGKSVMSLPRRLHHSAFAVKDQEAIRHRRARNLALGCVLIAASVTAAADSEQGSGLKDASVNRLLATQAQSSTLFLNANQLSRTPANTTDRVRLWNEIALDTTAIDHTPVQPGETRVFGEQFGPARSARAMAIVHIGLFDGVNAIYGRYQGYSHIVSAPKASADAAIGYAAHDTLVWLYPSQKPRLDGLLEQDMANISGASDAIQHGIDVGKAAAAAIIERRTNDGSQYAEPQLGTHCTNRPGDCFTPNPGVGKWSQDPISQLTVAIGAYWSFVKPFVLDSASQFRVVPPPALNSEEYARAFREVKAVGGNPVHGTGTVRTQSETFSGKFWSYDGTPTLCAPPRLYNQVAGTVSKVISIEDPEELARFLALVNVAMADAALTAWESKYFYQFWRPVTGIRAADQGNPNTIADPTFYPLGAQDSNASGPNFTPPFPSYPSGHATIGGALFQMLRHFTPDATPFVFVSDEWNGETRDVKGDIRPYMPQSFLTLSQAEEDNAISRIWLGVHWRFDADQGDSAGRKVADYVFGHAFLPISQAP
jgi:hypothetical protein